MPPNFGAFHPQGRTQVPLLVAIANLLFFGDALAFFWEITEGPAFSTITSATFSPRRKLALRVP